MKKRGFKRKIKIEWDDPGVIFPSFFLGVALFSSGIIAITGADWSKCWPLPALFAGVGVIFLLIYLAVEKL